MALLDILHFPDERLRTEAAPVTLVDEGIRTLIGDMFETMYHAPGIGLAATQINVHKQIMVIDITENRDQPLCFINPVLINTNGEEEMEEGCLSVPGVFEKVKRAERITVQALNQNGESFELEADGLLAVCIQHEMDHLKGLLFVDYLSKLKKQRIRKKLEKQAKAVTL